MDPATTAFLTSLAADLSARAISTWSRTVLDNSSESRLEDVDDGFYALPGDPETTEAILDSNQLADIAAFLKSSEVESLVRVLFLARVLPQSDGRELIARVSEAFEGLATAWCRRLSTAPSWDSLAFLVWRQVLSYYQTILPSPASIARLPQADRDRIASFMQEPEELRGHNAPLPVFVRELLAVTGAPERLAEARNNVQDIVAASAVPFSLMRLNHAQDDYRYSFDDLYIERTLKNRQTSMLINAGTLISKESSGVRVVVIGDPGVGKSTLVDHLIHMITKNPTTELAHAPLLLRCRDYAPMMGTTQISDALRLQLGRELQLGIDAEPFHDILRLGCAFVVFDGVDEVMNLGDRRLLVERIEAFAARFPLISILVTSRKLGYSRASFQTVFFDVFELQEYAVDQVYEYADRWFQRTDPSGSIRDGFLRESQSVEDIRTNPLMLSLLCILYRARGYIPRNRREIYRECADLLFFRWDSMRRLDQPLDHRRHGHYLMQDLAQFFALHQSAQAGVEERQLRGIIASFLIDTAGVERFEATRRATEFLDFCSNRAWLLSSKGTNSRGQRLFGFTHRTFMEYYTAEAFVRDAQNLQSITPVLQDAYEKDSSSVLPELIAQCADDKFKRGAEHLVRNLLHNGQNDAHLLALCLRLINSAAISGQLTDEVLARTGDIRW